VFHEEKKEEEKLRQMRVFLAHLFLSSLFLLSEVRKRTHFPNSFLLLKEFTKGGKCEPDESYVWLPRSWLMSRSWWLRFPVMRRNLSAGKWPVV
jgi:hypothetical protein